MKKILLVIAVVAACSCAVVMWPKHWGADADQKEERAESEDAGDEAAGEYGRIEFDVSPEESSDLIDLFETYLEISQDYADSVAAGKVPRMRGRLENSEEGFEQNRLHVDSVLR